MIPPALKLQLNLYHSAARPATGVALRSASVSLALRVAGCADWKSAAPTNAGWKPAGSLRSVGSADILSALWAAGILPARRPGRLARWKLALHLPGSGSDPVSVAMSQLDSGFFDFHFDRMFAFFFWFWRGITQNVLIIQVREDCVKAFLEIQ